MKKILSFSILLLLFLFSFFLVRVTHAQLDSNEGIQQLKDMFGSTGDIPGVTCGDATNEKINRCCNTADVNTDVTIEDPRIWCLPFHGPCASTLPSDMFNAFIKTSSFPKQIEKLSKLAKNSGGCVVGEPDNPNSQSCTCKATALSTLCTTYFVNNQTEKSQCLECIASNRAVWTGLGCIKVSTSGFVSTIMTVGVGLAGIFALLCIIYAAFLMQTSAGNPERVKKARDYLTNCIIGLMIILFSIFILRVIGVNILQIPGIT
jgi:hypothetical protein